MAGTEDILYVLLVIGLLLTATPVQADGAHSLDIDTGEYEMPTDGGIATPGAGHFTRNMGQWPSHVLFVADTPFGRAVFSADGVLYDVGTPGGGHRVKVAFTDAAPVEPRGGEQLPWPTSYFYGNDPDAWVPDAPSYRELLYTDVWPGIDVRYYFRGETLKYDVVVGPDASPDAIHFTVDGAEGIDVADDRLDIRLSAGLALQDADLYAHYDDGEVVDIDFAPSPYDGYGFRVDKEPGRTLVIDPVVVHSSTFFGGTYQEAASQVELDGEGNIYFAGTSASLDLPITPGAYKEEQAYIDIFVTKMSYNASEVLWSTFLGGSSQEFLAGLEIDDEGYVYISGTSWSSDYPVTEDAYQKDHNQGSPIMRNDFIVTKMEPDCSDLVYSTYVGGYGPESGGQMRVRDGKAALVGWTDSKDFPATDGPFAAFHGDAILFIMSTNGSEMDNFQFWGGSGSERADCIAWADDGDIVVAGYTTSPDFFTTPGVFQPERPAFQTGFVSRYSTQDEAIEWATYCGGASEIINVITIDEDDYVYVGGSSFWSGPGTTYPVTPGAYDIEYNGRTEVFVSKMDPNGTQLEFSTLLGGDGRDTINDIEVLDNRSVVVVGGMENGGNYSVTDGCLDDTWEGEGEGYLMMFSPDGTRAEYSTFVGGNHEDTVYEVEITPWDNMVLVGSTFSKDYIVTEGAFQTVHSGSEDAFVTIIGESAPPSVPRNVAAVGGEGHIRIDWEEPEEDGGYAVRKYLLYRGTAMDRLGLLDVLDVRRPYIDIDVEYGVRNYYAVQADNFKGRSPLSNIASNFSFTYPDTPVNLTGAAGMDGILLEWEDPEFTGGLPLIGFRIYRGTPGNEPELLQMTPPGDMEFEDASVVDRTTYVYQLVAVNAYGESRARLTVTLRALGPPTQPLELTHTYGDLFVRLNWQPPGEDFDLPVEKYNVYRSTFDGPSEMVGTVPTRWFLDEAVEVGVLYYYRVTAENAKGEGEPSEELEAMVMVPSGPPTNVVATAHEGFVKITWTPPSFNGASPLLEYMVYTGTPGEGTSIGVVGAQGVSLVFLHDVPYDGVARSYYVTALNAEGESVPSQVARTRAFEVPGAPLDLGIERGDGVLTLGWGPPDTNGGTEIVSYILYRRAGDGEFDQIIVLPFGSSGHEDTDVENGVAYTYRITATNLVGESEPSLEVSLVPAGPPSPPTGVATEGSNGSVKINWVGPAITGGLPIGGYRVYGISEDMRIGLLGEVGPDAREFPVDGLVNGQPYLYAIRSFTQAGESRLSDIVEGMPVGVPSEPTGLVALWMEDHVYVSWSQPLDDGGSPVTGYSLRRDDWETGRWIQVLLLNTTYLDTDLERGSTYNYILRAHNEVNGGPVVRVGITIPLEEETPPETQGTDVWPLVVLGLALVVAVAVAIMGARRKRGGDER